MKPALSQVCSLNSPFERDVEDYAAGKCEAVEVWLTKLETFLESHTIDDVQRLCDKHGVTLPVASFQGGLLTSQGDARSAAWDLLARRLQLCGSLGISTLVEACEVTAPISQQDVERAQMSLKLAAEQAGQHGVRVALEPQAGAALGNNLQTVSSLVAEVGSPHLGVCLDVFHYYVGPSKLDDLAGLTSENLFHVQLCDLVDVPREFATDSHRILPGDGDISLEPIIAHLTQIGYDGCVSIEVLNPQIWQVPPLQFAEVAMTALRKLLGLASMGV